MKNKLAPSSPITRNDLISLLDNLFDHVFQLQVNRFIFKAIWKLIQ